MPLHPDAARIAARLPDDCPAELLLAGQRAFAKTALANALANPGRFISDELARKHAAQFQTSIEESRMALVQPWSASWIQANGGTELADLRFCLRNVDSACGEQLMDWVQTLCPDDFPALLEKMAATRKAWAKAQAAEFLAQRPQWHALAPDLKDAIATDVAEAWHAGLKARIYADLCADYESDQAAAEMTQGELYRWLLKQPPHVIARHKDKLSPPNALKFVKQFSAEQWIRIENCVSQSTPEQARRLARAAR